MNRVAIIDYGMGNLGSVVRAVEECGGTPIVTCDEREIETASRIILPGVGAFPDGMRALRKRRLDEILADQTLGKKVPLLGICLGMQLLATRGWEGEETAGLGWIDGEVRRLAPSGADSRIPHVGWNELRFPGGGTSEARLFAGIAPGQDFYFVHSFHLACRDPGDVMATTPYCGGFVSAVGRGSILGVQFHPEKSQRRGFALLRNFLSW